MKRFFALLLAVMMIAAVLCACGDSGVKTSVPEKYDDGFAKDYASSTSTDSNGNKVYEFTGDKYDEYIKRHKTSLDADVTHEIAQLHPSSTDDQATPYGEFVYINDEKKAVIVGVHTGQYDEATAKEEAKIAAEYGLKYFQNLKEPVNEIKVIYCDANNQETVFGTFDFKAE